MGLDTIKPSSAVPVSRPDIKQSIQTMLEQVRVEASKPNFREIEKPLPSKPVAEIARKPKSNYINISALSLAILR